MNNNVQKLQMMMIYHELYSLNQYRNEHYYKLNAIKKGWSNTVELACIWNKIQPVNKCILKFAFIFKDRRKRDIDNYSATVKMIIDGLVSFGILPDDNWNHVVKIEMEIAIQAKTEGVQVIIEEVSI